MESMTLITIRDMNIEMFDAKVNDTLSMLESNNRIISKITFRTEVSRENVIYIAFILHTQRKTYPNPCYLNSNTGMPEKPIPPQNLSQSQIIKDV
jgi:hypothetical protein